MSFRFLIKIFISAFVIAAVSEIGKRSSALGAILAALPLTSIMTMTWLYLDTQDPNKVADLSINIIWAIIPSFIFLLSLPWLLKSGLRFPSAMVLSCFLMLAGYGVYLWILRQFGIQQI
jgi:uncharacterized membrane protein (GlpM family)